MDVGAYRCDGVHPCEYRPEWKHLLSRLFVLEYPVLLSRGKALGVVFEIHLGHFKA